MQLLESRIARMMIEIRGEGMELSDNLVIRLADLTVRRTGLEHLTNESIYEIYTAIEVENVKAVDRIRKALGERGRWKKCTPRS